MFGVPNDMITAKSIIDRTANRCIVTWYTIYPKQFYQLL